MAKVVAMLEVKKLTWEEIPGVEAAKRALEVAAVGKHSVVLIAWDAGLAEALRRAVPASWELEISIVPVKEWKPEKFMARHVLEPLEAIPAPEPLKPRLPEIATGVCAPTADELVAFFTGHTGEPLEKVEQRVMEARQFLASKGGKLPITLSALDHLRAAIEKLSLGFIDAIRVARVATSVAALDGADAVKDIHMSEAIHYCPANYREEG